MKFKSLFRNGLFLSLCAIAAIISLLYPPIFTHDSGHYFTYLDILNGTKTIERWDPIRGIVFPLIIKLNIDILGESNNAILIPLIIALILLFALACYFVIFELAIESKLYQNVVIAIVFCFILLDPLVLGFYHVILTEYVAATCLALSCLVALKLYIHFDSLERFDRKLLGYTAYFVFAVLFAYHLKQPYVGAALYPLILITVLIIARSPKLRTILLTAAINGIVLLVLGLSIKAWNAILPDTGMAGRTDRQVDTYLSRAYQENLDILKQNGPLSLGKVYAARYCALSNVCAYNTQKNIISAQFSLFRANQNRIIGYRGYTTELDNMVPMREEVEVYVKRYTASSTPPEYLNGLLQALTIKSTFLFSLLYLLLPALFVIIAWMKLVRYRKSLAYTILFLCTGSALLNAVAHAIIYYPLDRYLFLGYPMLLVTLIILIGLIVKWLRANWVKRSSTMVQKS